ncbi:tyrosine-protein phosphatase non-receptor type 3-like [Stegostoma tigrinum]|uniref:tyrosine-protein phosphatase non-receptor type 3-like n=1 Tax=Stegostoma tigrinum TaxID=3053191 RepID=UPI0028706E1A|nr:tyrosine-protein phosphatase non-receptor type 3-like [Stegostoma tigrinum]
MTSRFRVLGGRTNHTRAFEIPRDKHRSEIVCNVQFLDGNLQSFKVNKQDVGQVLLDMVYKHLDLIEKEYFGLQFIDDSIECPRWLEPSKPIRKQFKGGAVNFRVRFFVTDPNALQQEQTRHLYFLQLKKDFIDGRLPCPHNKAALLASYAVQSELGEYNPSEHHPGYIEDFHFVLDKNQEFQTTVMSLHKQHRGLKQSEAELGYLSRAKTLEFYGVELHNARDQGNLEMQIGISSEGLRVYRNMARISFYPWSEEQQLPKIVSGDEMQQQFSHCTKRQRRSLVHSVNGVETVIPCDDHISVSPPLDGVDLQFLETYGFKAQRTNMDETNPCQYYCDDKTDLVNTDNGFLCVRMIPDEEGKFGFNLKGGVDQKMPLIVSRVSPGSPADVCVPKLNEGDQILLINGRDISEHTHDQVVMFIKASRESHSRELVLLVKRKVTSSHKEDKVEEEIDFRCFPNNSIHSSYPEYGDSLEESMIQLRKGLESGAILNQFDQLYRKRPGMAISHAKMAQNMDKNRYKDVLPYDVTRVVLDGSEDYINGSYVNMEICGTAIQNKYIASQGPLPHTCQHFWQTVWEQSSSLIVMLTTLTERGRVKCHQYWPDPPEVCKYGSFHVTCHSEEYSIAYVFREMTLTNLETGLERGVSHLQYVAWPDHGVPDDSMDFFDFVTYVRQKRIGRNNEPVIVHCSAGIGRTGVLIAMETAMCLIENNQPVYPLDIVRTMRDQRAMMVQTSSQYKFVCEAILRVYEEGLIQPLEACQAAS